MSSAPNNQIKRVLFVNGVPVDVGGIENTIMDIYRGINKQEVLIDFVVRRPEEGCYHGEIISYGGRIYNLFDKKKHKKVMKWNFYADIYSFFCFYRLLKREGPYSAVHIAHPNLDGYLIAAAKLARVPIRIIHSHNTGFDDRTRPSLSRRWIRKASLSLGKYFATHLWGCSQAACEYMFGKDVIRDKRAEVVQNPINIKRFTGINISKSDARAQMNVPTNGLILLNVARYATQKNHLFLIDVLYEALKIRDDLHLILIGTGPLEDQVKNYIIEKNVENNVTMLDKNMSVPVALKASDFFLLPSLYEGFGNTLIEAQAAGIPCFASTTCQPEPNLGLVDYLPLDRGAKSWAEIILSRTENSQKRKVDKTKLSLYELSVVSSHMESVYTTGGRYFER
ncbi:hypothetical protein A8L34_24955 [Bacillus sp. FJAT-27264]|nr:hypothetical protein A8L34_24955 [Bacillus sp. FJAT-27264]